MLGHCNFIKSGMHCSGLVSFQKTFSRIDHNDVWLAAFPGGGGALVGQPCTDA